MFSLQSQLEQQQQKYQNEEPDKHIHQMSDSYSSIVNHNYNHPTSSTASSNSSPFCSKSPSPQTTEECTGAINGKSVLAEPPNTVILRNSSSCSLEAGNGGGRGGEIGRDGPMSVSDVGPAIIGNGSKNSLDGCCNLKRATASN